VLAALFAMPVEETDGSHPGLDLEHRRRPGKPCSLSGMEKGDPLHRGALPLPEEGETATTA